MMSLRAILSDFNEGGKIVEAAQVQFGMEPLLCHIYIELKRVDIVARSMVEEKNLD